MLKHIFYFTIIISHLAQSSQAILSFGQHGHRHFSIEQRLYVAELINSFSSCNLLIIGTGIDSGLWMDINRNGNTVFVEHDPFWIQLCQQKFPGIQIITTTYTTELPEWQDLLVADHKSYLPQINIELINTPWDIIIIDGPSSHETAFHCKPTIGRIQSFFTVKHLIDQNQNSIYVIIHDTDRIPESTYAQHLFNEENVIKIIDNMKCYYVS